MVPAQAEYLNSEPSPSEKKSQAIKHEEVLALIEAADFSVEVEATIRKRSGAERGIRHYRRRHLNQTLRGMFEASLARSRDWKQKRGTRFRLFTSVKKYADHAQVCERTLRYNLRELDDFRGGIGVLRRIEDANQTVQGNFRHTAMHDLDLEVLRRLARREPVPIRPASTESHPPKATATSALPAPAAETHRATSRPAPKPLTPRESREVIARIAKALSGLTYSVARNGAVAAKLPEGDSRFRHPSELKNAIITAAMSIGRKPEDVRAHLDQIEWQPEQAEKFFARVNEAVANSTQQPMNLHPIILAAAKQTGMDAAWGQQMLELAGFELLHSRSFHAAEKGEQRQQHNLAAAERVKQRFRERFTPPEGGDEGRGP